MDIVLHTSTRNAQLNHLLCELIGLCEEALPGRIRTCYLGGSYSDGIAAMRDRSPNSSDVDLYIIFCGMRKENENVTFRGLLTEYQSTCSFIIDAQLYLLWRQDAMQRRRARASSFAMNIFQMTGVCSFPQLSILPAKGPGDIHSRRARKIANCCATSVETRLLWKTNI